MNKSQQLIISLIIGFWLIIIAIFSIQNIQLVSLKLLFFESIKIPVGVLITFFLAGGFFFGSLIPLILNNNKSPKKYNKSKSTKQKKTEFSRDWEEEKDPLFDWE